MDRARNAANSRMGDWLEDWGRLAMQLAEGVRQAHRALVPHQACLPPEALAELEALVAELAQQRIRIAICGEVKTGKSTLLNAIAGATLSPVGFEPVTAIPVRVTYGERTEWKVGAQSLGSAAALEDWMRANPRGSAEAVVTTPLDLLRLGGQVDLVDTPGVGAEDAWDAVTGATVASLDAAVLVVRYPGLYTRATRDRAAALEQSLGKLFVVWNLDSACAELGPEARARHAAELRSRLPRAREVFLVDARAGFEAARRGDPGGVAASGLAAFAQALRDFAASSGRRVAALREGAKRSRAALEACRARMDACREELEKHLAAARAELERVRRAAEAEIAAAEGRLRELRAQVGAAVETARSEFARLAEKLRRDVRRARRRWILRGDAQRLQRGVQAAVEGYRNRARAIEEVAAERLRAAAAGFGAPVSVGARDGAGPTAGAAGPQARLSRAAAGRARALRRALWHRWYLPGLDAFERAEIAREFQRQQGWLERSREAVEQAAAELHARRVGEIEQRAAARAEQVRAEANFCAREQEFAQLGEALSVAEAQIEKSAKIAALRGPD